MEDGLDVVAHEGLRDERAIATSPSMKIAPSWNRRAPPTREIVDDDDVVAAAHEGVHHVRADVARTARHQDFIPCRRVSRADFSLPWRRRR